MLSSLEWQAMFLTRPVTAVDAAALFGRGQPLPLWAGIHLQRKDGASNGYLTCQNEMCPNFGRCMFWVGPLEQIPMFPFILTPDLQ